MTTFWGTHIWNFLHILCEKIDDNYYLNNHENVNNIIYLICTNLPCPDCSEHASNTLKNTSFPINKIKNKDDLTKYIFYFHNEVNKKLNSKQIEFNDYLENFKSKYKNANIYVALKNYNSAIQSNKSNENLILHRFSMNRNLKRINSYFSENINRFT